MTSNEEHRCHDKHEICRIRASILPIISGVLFGIAIYSFISNAGNPKIAKIFNLVDPENLALKEIVDNFYRNVYTPFLYLFIAHLIRIYLSILVIDEDPEFYFHNLRPLCKWKRVCEYVLRSLILVSLLLLVKDYAHLSDKLSWIPYLSKTYFVAAIYIYLSLLIWDVFMLFALGIKNTFTFESPTRLAYLISDIAGIAMAIIIVFVEWGVIEISSLPTFASAMSYVFLISLASLVFDLVWAPKKQWFKNSIKYWDHFFMFFNYFKFPCSQTKLLSHPCPVKTKSASSAESVGRRR